MLGQFGRYLSRMKLSRGLFVAEKGSVIALTPGTPQNKNKRASIRTSSGASLADVDKHTEYEQRDARRDDVKVCHD
jgi:hypothetical protein